MASIGDFQLLPPDPGVISPDVALDAALGVTTLASTPDPDPSDGLIGRGWDFDFATGQFKKHGLSPAGVSELEQLRVWIQKTLLTARYAHPIYTAEHGTDDPFQLLGGSFAASPFSAYATAVEAALLAHSHIVAVTDFSFQHADPRDDALTVSFTVHLGTVPAVSLPLSNLSLRPGA